MTAPRSVHLLPLANRVSPAEVLAVHARAPLFACDFYVDGAEDGEEVAGGYRLGRVTNVDHHAPVPRMARRVTSTELALRQVAAEPVPADAVVVIHHTDCDSVLSSAVVAGRLAPDPVWAAAALAADHTGEENAAADLLQALEDARDWRFSLEALATLRRGAPLPERARESLERRRRRRAAAEQVVARGGMQREGPLAWAVLAEETDGAFFPALLPDAAAVLLAAPLPTDPTRWLVKVRLGLAAPEGTTLDGLGITGIDPAFGGRWNAGSNRRAGGTALEPEAYARMLAVRLRGAVAGG